MNPMRVRYLLDRIGREIPLYLSGQDAIAFEIEARTRGPVPRTSANEGDLHSIVKRLPQ